MQIKVKKLLPIAQLPTLGSSGAACFDVYATTVEAVQVTKETPVIFGTGLAFEIPVNHVMLVYSRSGHGFKSDIRLSNAVGVLDSDYRGELKVKLAADGAPYNVLAGERIAQVMVIPVPTVCFELVDELNTTDRGIGGFGSSGR